MNWSRIKTALILLLVAVNIYLIYIINVQSRVSTRIDPDELRSAEQLLASDGIYISAGAVGGRQPTYKVWRSGMTDGDELRRDAILSMLFGTSEYTPHLTADGVDFTISDVGTAAFYDSDPFYIKYIASGCDYDGRLDAAAADTESDRQTGWLRKLNLAKQMEDFLNSGLQSENPVSVYVTGAVYDRTSKRYVAHFIQRCEGCDIDGSGGIFAVRGDKVEYIDGSVILMTEPQSMTASLLDEVNILFREKERIDDERTSDIEQTAQEDGEDITSSVAETVTVTDITAVYCVNWNADRSEFYLIPSWQIDYRGGDTVTRNAVSGAIYR